MTPTDSVSRVTPEGIYGSLAVAVVCLAWAGDDVVDLGLEVLLYSTALWLFHIYARTVHGGWEARSMASVRHWAVHEWPHLEAALPALAVVAVAWVAGLAPVLTADLAMWATVANLMVWQAAILRPARRGAGAIGVALVLNVVVLAALVALRLKVK